MPRAPGGQHETPRGKTCPIPQEGGPVPSRGVPRGRAPPLGSSVFALQVCVSGAAPPPLRGPLFSPAGPRRRNFAQDFLQAPCHLVPVTAALRLWSSETWPPDVTQGHGSTVPLVHSQPCAILPALSPSRGLRAFSESRLQPGARHPRFRRSGRGPHPSEHLRAVPGHCFTAGRARSFQRCRRGGASGPFRSPDSSGGISPHDQTKYHTSASAAASGPRPRSIHGQIKVATMPTWTSATTFKVR